jgi:tetratricopeptide (TPR) repeat protein
MKTKVAIAAVVALSAWSLAQDNQSAPSPSQPQTAPAQPSGRPPIQAKSQAEYQAYQAAVANVQNPEAMEKAADDFAGKFPDSQLRVLLYRAAMHSYQSAGNSAKMLEMGLKVLGIDKDDPEALIGVAEVQEEHTSPTDLDRDQRMTQAMENANHALQTIDTDLAVPAGTPQDKLDAYKKYLRGTALSIIGAIQYKREQYGDAETTLKKALEADPGNQDPVVTLRLALALDQEKKYPEALQQANKAVELTKEDSDVGKMARTERDRLLTQTGNTAPGASPGTGAAPGGSVPTGSTSSAPPANTPQNSAPPSH